MKTHTNRTHTQSSRLAKIERAVLAAVATGGVATINVDATSAVHYDDGIYVNGKRVPGATAGAQANITATNNSVAIVTQRVQYIIG